MSSDPSVPREVTSPSLQSDDRTICEGDTLPPPDSVLANPLGAPAALIDHPRYRIVRLLGMGGMGAVYQAEHKIMKRLVALKVIRSTLVQSGTAVERFRREVHAAARLVHPNIVTAYDAEQVGDTHFLAMELVDGVNLADIVRDRGPLPVPDACDYIRQAALGLQHACERGMVHRDIKPHNLMVDSSGQVKILDFGLARFASENSAGGTITEPGSHMGTPDFMAPEQARDPRAADIRADIYSLGCTLYYLLSGQEPFPGGTAISKAMAHIEKPPRPLGELRGDIPLQVQAVVERMMAKDPAQRFQTPAEVAAALAPIARQAVTLLQTPSDRKSALSAEAATAATTSVLEATDLPGSGLTRPRRWLVPAAVAAVAIVGVLAAMLLRPGRQAPATDETEKPRETTEIAKIEPSQPPNPAVREPVAAPEPARRSGPATPTRLLAWPEAELEQGKIPAPDLANLKPVFHDDFSNPRSGWPTGRDEGVAGGYENGRYFLQSSEGPAVYRIAHGPMRHDFVCRIDGRNAAADTPGWGVAFAGPARDGKRRGIQLKITSAGVLQIFPIENNPDAAGPHSLGMSRRLTQSNTGERRGIRHSAIKAGTDFNALLVVVRHGIMEIYVNSIAVCDPLPISEGSLPSRPLVTGWFGPHGGRVEFARLTVWPAADVPSAESRGAVAR